MLILCYKTLMPPAAAHTVTHREQGALHRDKLIITFQRPSSLRSYAAIVWVPIKGNSQDGDD
jgi:hypothetical protein